MKRPKFERRLQKALNHLNKAIIRLDQLDTMEEPSIFVMSDEEHPRTIWWFLAEELGGLRRRVLFSAQMRGIELDEEGMPR